MNTRIQRKTKRIQNTTGKVEPEENRDKEGMETLPDGRDSVSAETNTGKPVVGRIASTSILINVPTAGKGTPRILSDSIGHSMNGSRGKSTGSYENSSTMA